jgi:hypothetical protein
MHQRGLPHHSGGTRLNIAATTDNAVSRTTAEVGKVGARRLLIDGTAT